MSADRVDALVVGGGNAGFCAAHAARETGASVLMLEKSDLGSAGGNSFYTAGAFRVAHDGLESLTDVLDPAELDRMPECVLPPYSEAEFWQDMVRVTGNRTDERMAQQLIKGSHETLRWLRAKGVRWRLMHERQAYVEDQKLVFFGGLSVGAAGGGKGLIEQHTAAAVRSGIAIRYSAAVDEILCRDDGSVAGVRYVDGAGARHEVFAGAVVLAAGGFEADPRRRARHLGPEWAAALVRGTPSNTGEVLDLALELGAAAHGDWTTCHSVAWDAGAAPEGGNRELTNQLTRGGYPLGIVVDRTGVRFIDEGADYRNYTYAKYGADILRRPGGVAFQLFDSQTRPLLRTEEYDSSPVTSAVADTIPGLASALGIDPERLRATVTEFNASIADRPFTPAVKDGRLADVYPPKSNWAVPLVSPPYYGFPVMCGITFTFGGLHVDARAAVQRPDGTSIRGLFAAGEIVGGLFAGNYPGGAGLTAGAVWGRTAGTHAAHLATGD